MTGLALFLTAFIMAPTFQQAYEQGVAPLSPGRFARRKRSSAPQPLPHLHAEACAHGGS